MPDDQPSGAPADQPTDRAADQPAAARADRPTVEPGATTVARGADAAVPAGASPEACPRVVITYCTQCRWLLRAAWYTQELLTTFHRELGEVALRPGNGGVFTVEADGQVVWDRKVEGGFPEITVLKRRVRDVVAPDKPLGHSDGL
ncbi:SelT/SelW/SelH family protein [Cellulomonas sp. H30R-01]|uniref:SelT/SelW/SelH family protein n=1 Tax=Cellulomonas sp. H30R-01 TaxID=2704467 RepID=UPI00138BCB66|nr:SelT/SelW/SelH family protein [Cellulomonas sp. H30R-01]QHT54822.1 SelT/SelW/SelH family protein [Cellulomonas sp. H30R-01]